MQNFLFSIPTKVYFGRGEAGRAGELASQFGEKALIVLGGGSSKKNGSFNTVVESLTKSGITYEILSGVQPNPRITSVNEGVKICRDKKIDVLLPIGGGSVIDCTKAIAACVSYNGDAWDVVKDNSLIESCLPIIAVPTMAASGSEMDGGSMIINSSTHDKLGLISPELYPRYTLMDPTFTFTIPKKHTAAGAVDIMSHVFEVYFSKTEGAFMPDRMMEAVLKTCVNYGGIACAEPDNYEARANLMWASSWGCNGFFNCGKIGRRWSVHPIEHQLGAYYDETHGIGLAILTPHWMRHILSEKTVDMFSNYGTNVLGIGKDLSPMEIAGKAIDMTESLFHSWGIPENLRESGIGLNDKTLFDEMADKALGPTKKINAFIPLGKKDVLEIMDMAY